MLGLSLATVLTLGAGCTMPQLPVFSFLPKTLPATDINLSEHASIQLEQTAINPLERLSKQPQRLLDIQDWVAGDRVTFSWSETYERETAASIEARSAAERATPVGQEANVPEPVYETISLAGSLKTHALDDGQRILLPSEWPATDHDLTSEPNTLIWLSRAQYDELSSTRHTHLSIGVLDAGLQTVASAAGAIQELIAKISGSDGADSVAEQDVTEIVADAEWGTYTLMYQGEKVKVQTLEAENKFASYVILANPENPLILEVELKSWAYGTEALGLISEDLQVAGYSVSSIAIP